MPRRAEIAKPIPGRSVDWAPRGPNDEPPNLILAHTERGSIFERAYGKRFGAVAYVRADGVQYDMPVDENGEADEALQLAGFFHAYAHRFPKASPHFKPIRKGETP